MENTLKNELHLLERYAKGPVQADSSVLSDELTFIENECDRIKEAVWQAILNKGFNSDRIVLFIDFLTNRIIDLSQNCYGILRTTYGNGPVHNYPQDDCGIYIILIEKLNELIHYFKAKFSGYFNNSLIAPEAYAVSIKCQFIAETDHIISTLKKHKINKEIVRILERYFTLETEDPNQKDSFGKLDYYQYLISSICRICNNPAIENLEGQIIESLVYLNFNQRDFISIYRDMVRKDYFKILDMEHELSQLTITKRNIQQLQVRSRFGFEPEAISLQGMLDKILKEEIKCLKEHILIEKDHRDIQISNPTLTSYFFEVSFTLKELLFFFRLMVETGLVMIKHRTGIYQFIAKHIHTRKFTSLSVGSMKRKFNQTDQKGVKKIREALLTMIRLINEKYLYLYYFYCLSDLIISYYSGWA